MYPILSRAAVLLLCLAPAVASCADVAPPAPASIAPALAYAALPQAREARLSPDGRHLAYIGVLDGHSALVVRDVDGHGKPVVLPTGDGEVNWILWKSDDRLVFSVEAVSVREPLRKTEETRLIGVDRDGSHLLDLVHADDADFQPQIQDRIVSELPDDPDHLLLQLPRIDRTNRQVVSGATLIERLEHPEVVRVDVRTGEIRTVTPQNGAIGEWIATSTGEVNLGWTFKREMLPALPRLHPAPQGHAADKSPSRCTRSRCRSTRPCSRRPARPAPSSEDRSPAWRFWSSPACRPSDCRR